MYKILKAKFFSDTITLLQFLLISFCFPSSYKKIIPLLIGLSLFQFYRFIKGKISLDFVFKSYFYLLVYSLIFFRSIHTLFLVLNLFFYIYSFVTTKTEKRQVHLKTEILILIFFGLIMFNNILFLGNLDTYLYFLFYPILFYCIKKKKVAISKNISMKIFVMSVIIASLFLLILNFYHQKTFSPINTYFAKYLGLTHVYFGMFLGSACCFLLMFTNTTTSIFNKKTKIILFLFFLILLIHIGARMSLFGALFILGVFFLKKDLSYYKKALIIVITLGILMVTFQISPRVKNGIDEAYKVLISIKNNDKEYLITNSWQNMNQRFLITKYTLKKIKENLFLGIGIENIKKQLGKQIHKEGYKHFEPINPHNQYLHFLLGMGLVSFFFFVSILFLFYKEQSKSIYFLLFFILLMFTESVLVRVKGISVFLLFNLILSLKNKND